MHATLSFSKNPQRTFVPWSSVYVVTCNDGRGVLYHEDVPEDVSIIATHPHGDRAPDETVEVGAGRDIGDGGDLADLLPGEDDGDEAFETPAQKPLAGAQTSPPAASPAAAPGARRGCRRRRRNWPPPR